MNWKVILILVAAGVLGFFFFAKNRNGTKPNASVPVNNSARSQTSFPLSSGSPQIQGNNPSLQLPSGFKLGTFTLNLGAPRDLEFSPGGTLLASIPDQGRVVALPDRNSDGVADETKNILTNLNIPHGLAFYQNKLYVAELTQVVRYSWNEKKLEATKDKVLFSLPYNGGHNTRSLVFNRQGQLFVTLGSSCNVCNENNDWLAAVIVSDKDGNNPRVFAKGLKNSVFLSVNPKTNEVWAGDMGRDLIGDDIPPEEINILRDGGNYGWPICYDNKIHDTNFDKKTYVRDPCADTVAPIYTFQAHSAPLGLTFINSSQFPSDWQGDLLVVYHGSWNRSVPTGYKVVHMKVTGNNITGDEDFLTGFLPPNTSIGPTGARGRPVDVIFDSHGSLFISDDKAGAVYKVIQSN